MSFWIDVTGKSKSFYEDLRCLVSSRCRALYCRAIIQAKFIHLFCKFIFDLDASLILISL